LMGQKGFPNLQTNPRRQSYKRSFVLKMVKSKS
jgi:hypothetical protein